MADGERADDYRLSGEHPAVAWLRRRVAWIKQDLHYKAPEVRQARLDQLLDNLADDLAGQLPPPDPRRRRVSPRGRR